MDKRMTMEPEALRRELGSFWQRHRFYAGFAIGFAGGAGFMFIAIAFAILLGVSLDGGLG